jgi:hypothetical protein
MYLVDTVLIVLKKIGSLIKKMVLLDIDMCDYGYFIVKVLEP